MADSKASKRPAEAQVVSIDFGGHRARVLARRDDLIQAHLGLVEQIARQVGAHLPPSFDLDDLVGVGNEALTRAAVRYRPSQHGSAPFSAYARLVVRGAMLDSVRGKRYRENTTEPLPVDRVERIPPARELAADVAIDSARLRRRVEAAIELLPPQQRSVLSLYYGPSEPSLAEVGRRMGISRSRAQQVHSAAVDRMRELLRAV